MDVSEASEIHPERIFDAVAGDPARYRTVADTMAARARHAGEHRTLVLALGARAWADRSLLDGARAKATLDEAALIARRHGLRHELADVLALRSAVNQELGRLAAAQRDLDTASSLASPGRAGELRFRQAILLQNAGRLAEAEQLYRALLPDPLITARVRVVGANNLALILSQQGRHDEALRRLAAAQEEAPAVGPAVVALVAQSTAWATVQSGRLREGLALFDRAAAAYTSADLPMAEHYIEYVDALLDLWLLPEARRAAREATDALADLPLMGLEARLRVAQIAVLAQDAAEAVTAAAQAVTGFEHQHRQAWTDRARLVAAEARLLAGTVDDEQLRSARRVARRVEHTSVAVGVHAHLIAGRLAAALGRTRPAVQSLTRAAELSRGSPALVRLRGLVAAALAASLENRDGDALRYCARGLQDLARHRSALPSMELRARASSHGVELGRIGLDLAIRSGSAGRVLSWMERTRAAALLAVEPPPAPALTDDLAALRAVQAELNLGVPGDPGDPGGSVRKTGVDRLVARQREIEERIRRATWRQAAPQARGLPQAALPELRRALHGATLVEYGRYGSDLVAVVVGPQRTRLVPLGPLDAVRAPSDALFFALRRLSRPRPAGSLAAARMSADASLARLRSLFLDPLRLAGDEELVVVPFGPLHGLPWSALHDGPVTSAPSASFWQRTHELARSRPGDVPSSNRVVIVAGPELEGAAAEALALGKLYPEAEMLAPPDSTVAHVIAALEGARTVHLACHGQLRADNPMFSSLLLSDGSLTVQELTGGAGSPHRVILAACESGRAVHYAGDEFVGFVSALMARGTAGVLASIAAIPDLPTVTLMTALHERLLAGDTLARALHGARATLDAADPSTFVTWCTLTAHGAA